VTKAWIAGLTAGIVVGLCLPVVAFGVGATHLVCVRGPEIGTHPDLRVPAAIGLAPPGGLENLSYVEIQTFNQSAWQKVGITGPADESSIGYLDAYNWTGYEQSQQEQLGEGSSARCPSQVVVPSGVAIDPATPLWQYGGLPLAPPIPAGIGNRVVLNPQQPLGPDSAVINVNYSSSPVASFWWNYSSGLEWWNLNEIGGVPVEMGPYYEDGVVVGLGIQTSVRNISFGVPIATASGGTDVIPASFPSALNLTGAGTISYFVNTTYIFPNSSDQGTWDVYLTGPGSPISPGGFFFVQVSSQPPPAAIVPP